MATYKVKLGSSEGELFVRQVHGHDPSDVRRQFQNEGYYVFSVAPVLNITGMLGFRKKVPHGQFLIFNKEFRGLVKAGLPIVEGLDILLKRMKPGRLRTLLEEVRGKLRSGESLSGAFRSYEDMIPAYYPALLHAGEQSGNLAEVLSRFIDQEDRLRKTRKRFLQSLTYPAILLGVAMISAYIILTRAMPQFASMYAQSEKEIPRITRIVMSASDWLLAWYPYLFGGLFLLVVAARIYMSTARGARVLERVLLHLPLLGSMWALQNQNIFARTMRMLLGGGITVPQSLYITADALPSPTTRANLRAAYNDLMQGCSLQEALDAHTRMEDMVGEMVSVGESTGTLSDMLDYLAEAGEEKAEDHLERITNLVAPLMLVAVGLLIAFLVIAMYLPMFGSYDTIGI